MARVAPKERGRFAALLKGVLRERPDAMPLVTRTLPDLMPRLDDHSLTRYLARAIELFGESVQKAESFLRLESEQGQRTAAALERA